MNKAKLAVIQYVDLSQFQGISTHEFFSEDANTICTLSIVGWCLDVKIDGIELVKVLYVNDEDGAENSEGMVIPVSCILERTELEPIEVAATISDTKEIN